MILRYQANASEIPIPPKEALRYAGQGAGAPSVEVDRLFSSCLAEFESCAAYRAAALEIEVVQEEGELRLGPLRATSQSLAVHLAGCNKALLFCATVGGELDRLLLRYGKTQPGRALMLDAIGSAAVEAWCDKLTENRPRFSPGYGDFPLRHQRDILALLLAAQTTGITMTSSQMLVPQKSVAAIIGLRLGEPNPYAPGSRFWRAPVSSSVGVGTATPPSSSVAPIQTWEPGVEEFSQAGFSSVARRRRAGVAAPTASGVNSATGENPCENRMGSVLLALGSGEPSHKLV